MLPRICVKQNARVNVKVTKFVHSKHHVYYCNLVENILKIGLFFNIITDYIQYCIPIKIENKRTTLTFKTVL